MNYPGIGNAAGGAYSAQPVAWNNSASGFTWSGSMGFNQSGTNALMFNIPKLTGGDVWTQAYLTFYLSSDTTATTYNVGAWWQYFTGASTTDTHFGGSNVSPLSLTGGAPGNPVSIGMYFPYLVNPPTQGNAKPFFIDLSTWTDHTDFLQSALASANNYNSNGILAANHTAYSGFRSDINLIITWTSPITAGSNGTIYNPILTMFSNTTYAYQPPASGGGIALSPILAALGLLGDDDA